MWNKRGIEETTKWGKERGLRRATRSDDAEANEG